MESPMPNEAIEQVKRLADMAEIYEGFVFSDMNGNILTKQFIDDDDDDEGTERKTTDDSEESIIDKQGCLNKRNRK